MEIRGKAVSHASFKNKNREPREKNLIKTIADMDTNETKDNAAQLDDLKMN